MRLAEDFVAAFSEESAPHGWRPEYVDDDEFILFARPMSSGMEAEVGLDLTERDYGLSLNPTLSVRHGEISRLHAQFFGFEQGASQTAASLSDLARAAGRGGGVMWTLESGDGIRAVVREILDDISQLGEPFYARFASVSDLVSSISESAKTNLDLGQLAVAYAVTEDFESLAPVLSRLEDLARQQPPLLAEQTKRFLAGFRAYFGHRL